MIDINNSSNMFKTLEMAITLIDYGIENSFDKYTDEELIKMWDLLDKVGEIEI